MLCVHAVPLVPSNLHLLCTMLKDVETNWLSSTLGIISELHLGLNDMLDTWLRYYRPDWYKLESALRSTGHTALADQIQSGKREAKWEG